MNEQEKKTLAWYLAEYISEEAERGNTEPDQWMLYDAIEAYLGGAAEGYEKQVSCLPFLRI